MEYNEFRGLWGKLQDLEKGRPQSHYARIDVDFSEARNQGDNVVIEVFGDYLAKVSYTGNSGDATIKLNHRNAQEIRVTEFKRTRIAFSKLYLSSSDTSGHFIFMVGGAFTGEVEPSTGDKVGLNNTSGVNINPATEDTLSSVDTSLNNIEDNLFDSDTDNIQLYTGTLIAEELDNIGSTEQHFTSQAVKRDVAVHINDMGSNTYIIIGKTGGVGFKFTAVGGGISALPVSNVSQIYIKGDNAANDGKVAYVGV